MSCQILKKSKNKNDKINRIFFISDIHIRNESDYNSKYNEVFENLYKNFKLNKINCNTDLICICGDIVNNPNHLTANSIKMLKKFFYELSEFCDVLYYIGNHDKREGYDDMISANIDEYFESSNDIYFMNDDKLYIYKNICFGHTKFNSTTVTDCSDYNDDYETIGLFHGIINGCTLENDIKIINRQQFNMSNFKKYKYCAFGDIHKHQFLDKKHKYFYPGSLLIQKRSESNDKHGYVLLNLQTGEAKFSEITSSYMSANLEIDDDGNLNCDIDELCKTTKSLDIRITCNAKNKDKVKYCLDKIKKNNVVIDRFLENYKYDKIDMNMNIGENAINIIDLNNYKQLYNFLIDIVKNNNVNELDDEIILSSVEDIINQSNSINNIKDMEILGKNVVFESVLFNDIMIFGKDNYIDFSSIVSMTGISSNNSSGKSIICEIIGICLFMKSPRSIDGRSFIRKGCSNGNISVTLFVNSVKYIVTRTLKYYKNSSFNNYCSLERYDKNENNEYINTYNYTNWKDLCNKKNKTYIQKSTQELDNIINSNIFSYQELYEFVIVSQTKEESFLKSDKKMDFLFKITNLSFILEIHNSALSLSKSLKSKATSDINTNIDKIFTVDCNKDESHETKINKILEKIEEYEDKYNQQYNIQNIRYADIKKLFNSNNNEVIKYEERLKKYVKFEDIDENIEDIENEINEYSDEISKINIESKKYNSQLKDVTDKLKGEKLKEKKYKNIEEKYEKFENEQDENIERFENEIKKLYSKLNKIKCEYCKNEYNESSKKIISLEKKRDKLNKQIENYDKIFDKDIYVKYKLFLEKENEVLKYSNYVEMYDKITLELKKKVTGNIFKKIDSYLFSNRKEYNDKLEKCKIELKKISKYNDEMNDICIDEDHTELQNKLEEINNEIDEHTNIVDEYNKGIENNSIKNQILKIETKLDREREKECSEYNEYIELCDNIKELEHTRDKINIKIEKTKNELLEMTNEKNNLINKLKIINNNKKLYNEYLIDKKINDELVEKNYELKEKFDFIENERNKFMSDDVIKNKIITSKANIKNIQDIIQKIKCIEQISNSFDEPFCYRIIETKIIPKLQHVIDVICKYIGHENIYIEMYSQSPQAKSKKIRIRTDSMPNIINSGMFYFGIMELIFRLAFININTYFKSNLIIIDEIYDGCSYDNKHIAENMVEIYKTMCDKILVVSHDSLIIDKFDNTLKIVSDKKNGNKIS